MTRHVFTYGSLMFAPVWTRVVVGSYRAVDGVLHGHRRFAVRDQDYPGTIVTEGASVDGVLYLDVDDADVARLDHFEGDDYRRGTVSIACADGDARDAQTYLYLPRDRLLDAAWEPGALRDGSFPGDLLSREARTVTSVAVDVAVIGAGAAGMMCAAVAGQRGRSVMLLDHARKLAEKIRISGGGRCNFTNRTVRAEHFVSDDPAFANSALARYRPRDFIAMVERHRIRYHEKHRGQLFCDDSSARIIDMLVAECAAGHVQWMRPVRIADVARDGDGFRVDTDDGAIRARRVVVATGGLSIPKIGATDFAYRLARRFGLPIVEPRPALVPLTFQAGDWSPFVPLAGVALAVDIGCVGAAMRFREDLLFTHRGLSGPAILQISNYWHPGAALQIDLAPASDLGAELLARKDTSRQNLSTVLAEFMPRRLVDRWQETHALPDRRIAETSNAALTALAAGLKRWGLVPSGTEGFAKAEVTTGGVATDALSADTLEAHAVPGLHVIGEAVDVTGWLGGYNFQWAWSSGFAAGQSV